MHTVRTLTRVTVLGCAELKADLRDLFINSAKEVDISSGRKAIVIHVPFRLLKAFHKVQIRLVRELEKKFSGKDVVIVANRRILPKPTTGSSIARPRSRTLTAVHAALLEDLVFPTEIVGKRTRYRTDGSKLLKVFLDPKDRCVGNCCAAEECHVRTERSVTRALTFAACHTRVILQEHD